MTIPPTAQLWGGYGIPSTGPDGEKNAVPLPYLADRLSLLIAGSRTRDDENQALAEAGYSGPFSCYIIAHAQDPATGSLYGNQLVREASEFADLPLSAFLHTSKERSLGTRIWWDGGGGRRFYKLDPASTEARDLAVSTYAWTLNEYPYYHSMFADNVGEYRNSPNCYPGSPATTWPGKASGDVPYTAGGYILHEQAFFQELRDRVTPLVVTEDRPAFVLLGNLLWPPSDTPPADWPMFDGFMFEYLTGWHNSGHNAPIDEMLERIDAAAAWLARHDTMLATTQQLILKDAEDPEKLEQSTALMTYGQAMALLMAPAEPTVTLGGVAVARFLFRPAHSGAYLRWFEFPDLDVDLGRPLGPPEKDGSFRSRSFDRGVVEFNPTTGTLNGLPPRSGRITVMPTEPPPETTDPPPIVVETEDTTVTVTVEIDPKGDDE